MMYFRTQMLVALTMSALLVVLNIIAVTSGTAEVFYLEIDQFIKDLV